jgi:hypothetical protein
VRLWSIHPRYLDAQGLVALWREALLARAVLRGMTAGYRHHPQLERFRIHGSPRVAICAYPGEVHREALGQIEFEWQHLLRKLSTRSPEHYRRWRHVRAPECHPLIRRRAGPIEAWERT